MWRWLFMFPSSGKVKNIVYLWSWMSRIYNPLPHNVSMACRGQFYLLFAFNSCLKYNPKLSAQWGLFCIHPWIILLNEFILSVFCIRKILISFLEIDVNAHILCYVARSIPKHTIYKLAFYLTIICDIYRWYVIGKKKW